MATSSEAAPPETTTGRTGSRDSTARTASTDSTDSGADRFRVSQLWRQVPRAVWLVVLLHVLVMLGQTAVFPNIRAPDEFKHFDMVLSVEQGKAWPWPDPGTLRISRGSNAAELVPSGKLEKRLALADRPIPRREDRPSFQDGGGAEPSARVNHMMQHPPLYYLADSAALATMGDWQDDPLDRVFVLLRWSNVLFLAPLPLLLFAAARRLRLPSPLPLAASVTPLLVPEITRSGGSINNDNLLNLAGFFLTLLLVHVLTGDTSRRTAVWVGAVTTVALLTKGLALVFPAWIAAVYAVALYRSRRLSVLGAAVVAGAVTALGLLWWVHNAVAFGAIQPDGLHTEQRTLSHRFPFAEYGVRFGKRFVERMVTTFFVQDQAGTRLHDATWWLARVVLLLLVAGILVTLVRRTLPRLDVLVLVLPAILLTGLVFKGSWAAFGHYGVYTAMQGRYVHSAFGALAVAAVASLAMLPQRWRRPVPLALLGLGGVIHLANTVKSLSLFWAPTGTSVRSWDGARRSVEALVRWYALPPWVLLTLTICLALVAAVTAVEVFRRRDGMPGGTATEPRSS